MVAGGRARYSSIVGGPLLRSRVRSLADDGGVCGAVWAWAAPARSRAAAVGRRTFMAATFPSQPMNGKALSA
ncbi:MAG: hypothetical protein A2623_10930 [Caulobacterales bacterium RIFCSPHIGHO2_01_FULL_70_19]|nr:MAG: hypothetical protein A2623_10930 [Caulobacterales bacterium RIFCSPHIGHO2_01_FULL_70_19]